MEATHQTSIGGQSPWFGLFKDWWPIALGLLVLYVPTVVYLTSDIWRQEDHWHEPVMLGVSLYLMSRRLATLPAPARRANVQGWLVLAAGLLMYVLGRALDVISIEMASMIPVFSGVLWMMRGREAVKRMAFPIVFLAFAVPLPPFVLDLASGGLKAFVSQVVTSMLYYVGYPIAQQGVVIMIGPYQLMVADACSGMRSLYSLLALGLLFVYVKGYRSVLRSVVLVASLLPIGLAANMARVIALTLITYHLGDNVAQGAVHDILGIGVFIIDLLLLLWVDKLTARLERRPA